MKSETFEVVPDSAVKDRLGRVMVGREERRALVGKFLMASMTQAEFCRSEGLNATTFSGWLIAYRSSGSHPKDTGRGPAGTTDTGRTGRSPTEGAAFRELRIEGSTPLPVPGIVTVIPPDGIEVRGCDATAAVALIKALRGTR